jgi:hypothetical protein
LSRVFLFALLAALNPTLLAATTVMLLLPRPKRLLLGYLLGAYTSTITVGIVLVNWRTSSGAAGTTQHDVSPAVDIVLGLLALTVAAVVGTGRWAKRQERKRLAHADEPKQVPRWQQTLNKGSARDTYVVGVLLSFPGAAYLASLSEIAQLGLSDAAIVVTVIAVALVMLLLLELPLISFIVAPEWTPQAVEALKGWLSRNGAHALVIGCSVIGGLLVVRGAVDLLV